MILSDRELRLEIEDRNIIFDPPIEDTQVGDASIDLRLGPTLRIPQLDESIVIRPRNRKGRDLYGEQHPIEPGGYNLEPKQFVLGHSLETVTLPDYLVGRLEGKSGLARFGLIIHATSAHIDPGFSGVIVFEICNLGPNTLVLEKGMPVGHIIFYKMSLPPRKSYSGEWAQQQTP